jgi:glutamate synthase (NADPH/NADH) small chain
MSEKTQLDKKAKVLLEGLLKEGELKAKDRLQIPQQQMPAQPSEERIKNNFEVATGYTEAMARVEALRCLQCVNKPCVEGCPVAIDIPAFIKAIAEARHNDAIGIIKQTSLLPSVCGRVCPQETQCMERCTLGKALKDMEKGVAIGRLERFAADLERESGKTVPPSIKPETGKKVAVIGSGPAGITFAVDVRREGHSVTLFEALHKPGGVLMYGIPEFRLPKSIVEKEIDNLEKMGVEIVPNFVIGRSRSLKSLLEEDGYSAVFIGSGAGLPKFMGIPGENLVGVFSANEYLTRANLMKAYDTERSATPISRGKRVAVFGGGNVAMDAARTAVRLGAEKVYLVYRRTEKEMPARIEEVSHAKDEGVEFLLLQNATKIIGDENDHVTGIECIRYELGEPDESGRRSPVPIGGSEFVMDVDSVIVAIGNESNPLIAATTPEIEVDKRGRILVDENNETSMRGVFAGGDIVLGAATVILAMGEGRNAAAAVNARMQSADSHK